MKEHILEHLYGEVTTWVKGELVTAILRMGF